MIIVLNADNGSNISIPNGNIYMCDHQLFKLYNCYTILRFISKKKKKQMYWKSNSLKQ